MFFFRIIQTTESNSCSGALFSYQLEKKMGVPEIADAPTKPECIRFYFGNNLINCSQTVFCYFLCAIPLSYPISVFQQKGGVPLLLHKISNIQLPFLKEKT